MASATIETFCCVSSNVHPGILTKLQFDYLSYNVICIVSSALGIVGALYQVLPSGSEVTRSNSYTVHRQRSIINWLAIGDLFAALGILIRSVSWLCRVDIVSDSEVENGGMFVCASFAIWIRYFYTTTFLWTLCYAVDVYLVSKQKAGNPVLYHVFTWGVSAVLTTAGLGTLYFPSFKCHSGPWRVLPNYLLSYIPIVFVMIANPILYFLASKQVRMLLAGGLGQLTLQEHTLLSALKEKFFAIVLVFYVCWLPNVLNGMILWSLWYELPRSVLIAIWYAMAVVNPLQAVLNSLVYKGWGSCDIFFSYFCCRCQKVVLEGEIIESSSKELNLTSGEVSNLLTTNGENRHH